MPKDLIISKLFSTNWAITPEGFMDIYNVATREVDLEALATKQMARLEGTQKAITRDNVAVIPITGPIFPKANLMTEISGATSLEMFVKDWMAAENNPDIDTIIGDFDTPGGVVTDIPDAAAMIRNSPKKTVAYIRGTAASAGFWLASQFNEVTIAPAGLGGSIGTTTERSKVAKDGNTIVFTSSSAPHKRMDPEKEGNRKRIVKILDDIEGVFINDVAIGRNVSAEKVKADFGKGDMLVGATAVKAGMADRVVIFEDLMSELTSKQKDTGEIHAMNIDELKAKHPELYSQVLSLGKEQAAGEVSTLQAKVKDLTETNATLTASNAEKDKTIEAQRTEASKTEDRLKVLERNDAIRAAQDIKAEADGIVKGLLIKSNIPDSLYGKVRASIKHDAFVAEDGKFDTEAFSTHAKGEVDEWSKGFGAKSTPVESEIAGFGEGGEEFNQDTKDTAYAQECGDAASRMLSVVGGSTEKKEA